MGGILVSCLIQWKSLVRGWLGSTTNFIDVYSYFIDIRIWFLFFVRAFLAFGFWLLFFTLSWAVRVLHFYYGGNSYFLFLFPVAPILCDITLGGSNMVFFFFFFLGSNYI